MMSEDQVLQFWDDHDIFNKSIHQRNKGQRFVFYDGPPFATGLPHYGHILASTIKDVIPRFWTMKGKRIQRTWGWDCHGLPIENIIEQELKLKSRKEILAYGVAKFNNACRERVLEYAQEWKTIIRRMGRWVDMDHAYTTMDLSYMESVWWVFKTLWDKGLIYEGRKAMHICPRCETVLSNFEVTQGYKEITDISLFVRFELQPENGQVLAPWSGNPAKKLYALAWTTTPWTLPGNVALAVNPEATYEIYEDDGDKNYYLVEKGLGERIFRTKQRNGCLVGEAMKGSQLVGIAYTPLFPKVAEAHQHSKGWKIYSGDFVTTEEGTGIVHIAPAFGEDDMKLGQQLDLPFIQHVSMSGVFTDDVEGFAGKAVKPKEDHQAGDVEVVKYLAKRGALFAKEKYSHSYPHCWRCETPLLNYSATSWFVKVTELKDRMIELNQKTIEWVPEHFRDGRFGRWLEGARDWAISRSRYWGTPLPIWRAEDGSLLCVGSRKELEELSGQPVDDLHKDRIDSIAINHNGKIYRRIDEVLDCWFESGSMPYAQFHYPFEHREDLEKNFPAEFIGEGQDQTRGWFYTLHVLSTALKDSAAFKNVIVNGIVLAEDGKKMSKRLKNYPEPQLIMDKYGADAMRMYLCLSPAMEAENLNFSKKGVDEVYKKVTLLATHVLAFWGLYAPTVNDPSPIAAPDSDHVLDQWIIAKTLQLVTAVGSALETYHIPSGARPIVEYLQDLSTWYVRRSRDRFKQVGPDQTQAIQTLGWTLRQLAICSAPFMPMLSESLYQALKSEIRNPPPPTGGVPHAAGKSEMWKESVHLEDWPSYTPGGATEDMPSILDSMDLVRRLASLAHQKRAEAGIKVRQPLESLTIRQQLPPSYQELLRDETNVKTILTDAHQNEELILDTTVSDKLKEEGLVRDLVRLINAARKSAGLTINDRVRVRLQSTLPNLSQALERHRDAIQRATLSNDLILDSKPADSSTTLISGTPIDIKLKKQ